MDQPNINVPDLCVRVMMDLWPQPIPVFLRYRMLCVGCYVSQFQTVSDACLAHVEDRDACMAALRDTVTAG